MTNETIFWGSNISARPRYQNQSIFMSTLTQVLGLLFDYAGFQPSETCSGYSSRISRSYLPVRSKKRFVSISVQIVL